MLKVYNTLGREKQNFETLEPKKVRMYCCGPTVYDFLHVGNFRGPVFYNLVRNWLEVSGYEVSYIFNYTDVDDKILKRAQDENTTPKELSEKYIGEFQKDFASLELRPHTANPKVTEYIEQIIAVIEKLVKKNHAYAIEGEVFYSVDSFSQYGELSGRKVEDMQAGSRIEIDRKKRAPADFSLWKPAKPNEQSWPSPWGDGRPGWHIECTAMIQSLLGDEIDIHGGGLDLCFPHHENERAQGTGATGKPYARYWIHNNMFTFAGAKMSKSLGNVRTMRSFLEKFDGEVFKFFVLASHYRSESEFSEQTIHQAMKGLAKFYSCLSLCESLIEASSEAQAKDLDFNELKAFLDEVPVDKFSAAIKKSYVAIREALDDDFNTPQVFAEFHELAKLLNTHIRRSTKPDSAAVTKCLLFTQLFRATGQLMSLFQQPAQKYLIAMDDYLLKQMNLSRTEVDRLVSARWQFRQAKNFAEADRLRLELSEMGIQVQDLTDTCHWEVSK